MFSCGQSHLKCFRICMEEHLRSEETCHFWSHTAVPDISQWMWAMYSTYKAPAKECEQSESHCLLAMQLWMKRVAVVVSEAMCCPSGISSTRWALLGCDLMDLKSVPILLQLLSRMPGEWNINQSISDVKTSLAVNWEDLLCHNTYLNKMAV